MSHITPIQTSFTDLGCLAEACSELGVQLEQGQDLTVTDYYGHSVPVAARVQLGRYNLGFQAEPGGTYRMVADFWGIAKYCDAPKIKAACAGVSGSVEEIGAQAQTRLVTLLKRPYGVAATKKEVARNPKYRGFRLQEEKNEQGEVVRLTLSRRRY